MGSPKALLRYRNESFLDTLIGLLGEHCNPVIVVLGAEAERIRSGTSRDARFVVNPDYGRGMITSLQCGLRAVPANAEAALFTLVDHPAVSPATVNALIAAPQTLVRVPRYRGKRGHPVWFRRELFDQFLAVGTGGNAGEVIRGHAADTEFLDLDDPGITTDIDDAEAYRQLMEAAP